MVAKKFKSHVPKKLKVKKGDKVIVISGKSKGIIGNILKIITDKNRAIVSGVNMVKKHKKPGEIITKESSINISNIAIFDSETGKPTRVGFKFLEDGTKVRFSKRSGEIIK